MGKLNEIEREKTQSFGNNALKTVIEDDKVVFDAEKDVIEFKDDVKLDGKLLKKRGEQPIYDEVNSVEISASYTSGEQIATVRTNGKTKGIYVRPSVIVKGGTAGQICLKEEEGELFVSFDNGTTWKKIAIE